MARGPAFRDKTSAELFLSRRATVNYANGRCNREKPPCKYFHPPQHLKDQLLINGRNHLALKNALMQQMGLTPGQVLPGQVPAVVGGVSGAGAAAGHLAALDPISLALLAPQATSPYLSGVPGVGSTYAQYYAPQLMPAVLGHDPSAAAASPLGVMQQPVLQQKLPRTDRLEGQRRAEALGASGDMAGSGGAGVPGVPARRVQARRVGVSLRAPAAAGGRARRRLCHGVHGRRQGPLRPRPLPLFPPSPAPAGAP
ncbi:jg18468 [Pararge aegeria aegeria]|uniref:Jg18468 protein n=1 Tax=Pararge aegeria aegeria TaxID=348720 RepID=A0A8S4RP49_9NEOP|nr:jg18468 [Pararge aegeria aegeria]